MTPTQLFLLFHVLRHFHVWAIFLHCNMSASASSANFYPVLAQSFQSWSEAKLILNGLDCCFILINSGP